MPDTSLIVIGAGSVIVAAYSWWSDRKAGRAHEAWCATAARAEGVVTRIGRRGWYSRNEPTSSDENVHAVPVVRFKAANRVEYEFDARDAPMEEGAKVEVAYDPKLPSSARTVVRFSRLGCAVVLAVIGIGLLVWGVAGEAIRELVNSGTG